MATNPAYGGIAIPSTQWLVTYDAVTGDVSVEPEDHKQPWAATKVATPVVSADVGTLSLETTAQGQGCVYSFTDATLDTWTGAYLDAMLKIPSSVSGADKGAFVCLELGDAAAMAFLRADGVNLLGEADVAVDMTGWHRVKLGLQGAQARLWVDGSLMQSAGLSYLTSDHRVSFGIWAGKGYAETIWKCVQARLLWGGEALGGDALMTIGPTDLILTDLAPAADGSSWRVVPVDHTADATFSLAQPPVFTMADLSNPADSGILVECLASADPTGFDVQVTNLTWSTDLGYGAGTADIHLKWTRTGLVAP